MPSRAIPIFVAVVLVFGTAYRVWPVIVGQPALSEFFITEDGYLMLTDARNLAGGLGMSVSEGTIATNGVQPLQAIVFALFYQLADGDKTGGLVYVHLFHASISVLTFFATHRFAARFFAANPANALLPWAIAALWFLSPLLVRHSMNALETGLYTLMVLLAAMQFMRMIERGPDSSLLARLGFGVLCGLVFLSRNDAVFLLASIFAVWAVVEVFVWRQSIVAMVTRLLPPGLMSIVVSLPWLINNQINFGSIIPVSGPAQSLNVEFGRNASLLPSKLFETAMPMFPVPGSMERSSIVVAVCLVTLVVVLALFLWRTFLKADLGVKAAVSSYFLFGCALAAYYGLWFGAAHFLSRYLAPLAPILILAAMVAALAIGRIIMRQKPDLVANIYAGLGIAISSALLLRALLPGVTEQGHAQVVAWVDQNVPQEVWVGAVQTGTLGYWHDRTINLDGKVNPAALAARREIGHVLEYVVESEIDYIVDWYGVGKWAEEPASETGNADKKKEAFGLGRRIS